MNDLAQRLEALTIDPQVARAETPPGWLYTDSAVYALARERVFARGWHLVGDAAELAEPGQVEPLVLLEGCLDEPLLLCRDLEGTLRCLSNVCTHRAFPVVRAPCQARALRCGYHGRRFALDGRLLSMPEFAGCEGFPSPRDDLPRVELAGLGGAEGPGGPGAGDEAAGRLLFAALEPAVPFETLWGPVRARLGFFPWQALRRDPSGDRDHRIEASWALYLDNYLEGFHIPYVHPSLARALEWKDYRVEPLPQGVLQVAVGGRDDLCFELPEGHPDAGLRVAAYYLWLFPGTLFNLYPWGLSINLVEPLGVARTRVRYLRYVWREELLERGAGADLDQVEREDQAVVQGQQQALRARLYRRGRYAPRQEVGVHHFHRLLLEALRGEFPVSSLPLAR